MEKMTANLDVLRKAAALGYANNTVEVRVFVSDIVAATVEIERYRKEESQPLVCDYCGAETSDPWHGSGMLNGKVSRHIHACDSCKHLLPSNTFERGPYDNTKTPGEILSFKQLERQNRDGTDASWLSHILVGYIPDVKFKQLVYRADWNPDAMLVSIQVNGVGITNATFNEIVNEFANRMLQQKMQNERLDDMREAVKSRAELILSNLLDGLTDNAFKLNQQIEQLRDQAEDLVHQTWSMPFKAHVTDEMFAAAGECVRKHAPGAVDMTEKEVKTLALNLYRSMVEATPASIGDKICVKLPALRGLSISDVDFTGDSLSLNEVCDLVEASQGAFVDVVANALRAAGVRYEVTER